VFWSCVAILACNDAEGTGDFELKSIAILVTSQSPPRRLTGARKWRREALDGQQTEAHGRRVSGHHIAQHEAPRTEGRRACLHHGCTSGREAIVMIFSATGELRLGARQHPRILECMVCASKHALLPSAQLPTGASQYKRSQSCRGRPSSTANLSLFHMYSRSLRCSSPTSTTPLAGPALARSRGRRGHDERMVASTVRRESSSVPCVRARVAEGGGKREQSALGERQIHTTPLPSYRLFCHSTRSLPAVPTASMRSVTTSACCPSNAVLTAPLLWPHSALLRVKCNDAIVRTPPSRQRAENAKLGNEPMRSTAIGHTKRGGCTMLPRE